MISTLRASKYCHLPFYSRHFLLHDRSTSINPISQIFILSHNYAIGTKKTAATSKSSNSPKKISKKELTKKPVKKRQELMTIDKLEKLSDELLKTLWAEKKTLAKDLMTEKVECAASWQDIEQFRPNVKELESKSFQILAEKLNRSFLVSHFSNYLRANQQSAGGTKEKLIERVIEHIWQIKKIIPDPSLCIIKEDVISNPVDIYFILGQDGVTLDQLEKGTDTKINVNTNPHSYTIYGTKNNILKAKEEIKGITEYKNLILKLPENIKNSIKSLDEIPYIQDICEVTQTYIELNKNNQLIIYGRNDINISEASRLLNIAWKKSDQSEAQVVLINPSNDKLSEHLFLPIHDDDPIPNYHRNMNWYRVDKTKIKGDDEFILDDQDLLDSKLSILYENERHEIFLKEPLWATLNSNNNNEESKITSFKKLGEFFRRYMKEGSTSNSRLELYAIFGYILFHENSNHNNNNLFMPPISESFNISRFQEWVSQKNPTKIFLPRLSVLFDVVDDDLKIKDFIMSRRRLFMDTLMMDRLKDFRLVSALNNSLLGFQDVTEFSNQCKLKSLQNILCPKKYYITLNRDNDNKVTIPYELERASINIIDYYDYKGFILSTRKIFEKESDLARTEIRLLYKPSSLIIEQNDRDSQEVQQLAGQEQSVKEQVEQTEQPIANELNNKSSEENNESNDPETWENYILTTLDIANKLKS
ncbi:235_t:CDS:10 [Entrophospora sp. SA101]|nr:235_t:CDS:10 [Entrophospora sp. SA101]CAJ0888915.1 13241_t:CDS:10 [Entrophospora sp. SA101]